MNEYGTIARNKRFATCVYRACSWQNPQQEVADHTQPSLPFLFQHAFQGWCAPVRIFRRLGVRTRQKSTENDSVKSFAGDFEGVDVMRGVEAAKDALEAVKYQRYSGVPESVRVLGQTES